MRNNTLQDELLEIEKSCFLASFFLSLMKVFDNIYLNYLRSQPHDITLRQKNI